MGEITANLREVQSLGGERIGILDFQDNLWPQAGQYLPAQRIDEKPVPLPVALFGVLQCRNDLYLDSVPAEWLPGDRIALRPPEGRGFHLPETARAVGLLARGVSPLRLLYLVDRALAQGAAVTLFADSPPSPDLLQRLPEAVEVSAVSSLRENLSWPDFLAVDLPHSELDQLSEMLGVGGLQPRLPFDGQVLIRTAMPCHGLGSCGVCSVLTRRGWRLACVDGPVFDLRDVMHVAG